MIGIAAVTFLSAVSLMAQDAKPKAKHMKKKAAATAAATTDTTKHAAAAVKKDNEKVKAAVKKP